MGKDNLLKCYLVVYLTFIFYFGYAQSTSEIEITTYPKPVAWWSFNSCSSLQCCPVFLCMANGKRPLMTENHLQLWIRINKQINFENEKRTFIYDNPADNSFISL